MKPEPPVLRKLAKSWLLQNLGWCALAEAAARTAVESAFCLGLLFLTRGAGPVLLGWLGFHTVMWVLLYGGYSRIRVVLGISADLPRLAGYLERVSAQVGQNVAFRRALIRGSASRGQLTERSDVDILLIPEPGFRSRLKGILSLWRLRAESVFERVPLQARWLDYERYVPFNVVGEVPIDLRKLSSPSTELARLASNGLLISLSGIDGSGKTTVAHRVLQWLRGWGFDAVYFHGHRQAWYARARRPQVSFAIVLETLWEDVGRELEELQRYPGMKFLYDVANLVDYVPVIWKLAHLMKPQRIVIVDRYMPDVLAYLKSWGPMHDSVETLLLRMCPEPDVSILFEVAPREALQRRAEWTLPRLERFVKAYSAVQEPLKIVSVDAHRPPQEVTSEVMWTVGNRLGLPRPDPPAAELALRTASRSSEADWGGGPTAEPGAHETARPLGPVRLVEKEGET